MNASASKLLIVAALVSYTSICQAQMPGKVDLEVAELASELIGAPVFASDGAEIGEVADISFDEDGRPRRLRMTTAAILGLGARTVEIPAGAFTLLRRAVVFDLPAEAAKVLPELSEPADEK